MQATQMEAEFLHVRVLVGMITALAIARLLNGLSRLVQHPSRAEVYPVQLVWTLFLMLALTNFWWFELGLERVRWSVGSYYFVIVYISLYFFVATLLFPDRSDFDGGAAGFFHARQRWFYAILAAIFLMDIGDTMMKGDAWFAALGTGYPWRQLALALAACAARVVRDWRLHLGFAMLAVSAEALSIAAEFARD